MKKLIVSLFLILFLVGCAGGILNQKSEPLETFSFISLNKTCEIRVDFQISELVPDGKGMYDKGIELIAYTLMPNERYEAFLPAGTYLVEFWGYQAGKMVGQGYSTFELPDPDLGPNEKLTLVIKCNHGGSDESI